MKSEKVKILLDADVVIHFIKGGVLVVVAGYSAGLSICHSGYCVG
jgi:hypothetical protein